MIKKITLILLMFIWFLPFLIMLLIAFNSQNTLFFSDLLNISNITFSNFTNAWQEANFSQYFLNTIIITISSVIIILCITSLAGYIMGRFEFCGKKFIYSILVLSMGMPMIFFSIPVYQILRMLNCENSIIGLILAEIGGGHVIFILLFVSFFRSIPNEIEEAAVIDGANIFRQILNVDLPAIKNIIVIQFILQAGNIMSIGFEKAYALQTDMNMPASEILATYVYKMGLLNGDYGFSTAVGLFNSVINVILLLFVNKIVSKLNEGEGI